MEWLTESSTIRCGHDGKVVALASQHWVRADGVAFLVAEDPKGRTITGCPNIGPTMKPCTVTLTVAAGYSGLIRVGRHAAVLSTLDGLTDGTVPGTVHYQVRATHQHLVRSGS
jgi:hypothetical protein